MPSSPDQDLAAHLSALASDRGDTLRTADVTDFIHQFLGTLNGGLSLGDLQLYQEVEELGSYIRSARDEIAALRPDDIPQQFIASATDELDAIVGATEAATNQILDAAEKLSALDGLPSGSADAVMDIATGLYEACNFQDITGQRTTKIIKTLKHIEQRIVTLTEAFGAAQANRPVVSVPPPELVSVVSSDEDLLNGPQLPGNAALQAAIDALFNS